jgi:AAA family ATP:ADP antiporter
VLIKGACVLKFSKNFFQVILPSERKKFFTLSLIMFCLFFNYTLLRSLKDTLIVTSPNSGAEVITFIKFWFGLPSAFFMTLILRLVSKKFSRVSYFYVLTAPFACFFLIHAFFLVPHLSWLQPSFQIISQLQSNHPHFKWVFPLLGNWVHVLFFVLAELWGSACFYYLFWQVANQSTTKKEALRFFSLFGLIGNFAMIAAGRTSSSLTLLHKGDFYDLLQKLILVWLAVLLLAYLFYIFLCFVVGPSDESLPSDFFQQTPGLPSTKTKKLPLKQQCQYFFQNQKLKALFALVFCYGFSFNLIEALWKNQAKLTYPNPQDYNSFMSHYFELTGWFSIVLMGVGGWVLRRKGWLITALVTPFSLLLLGTSFFAFVFLQFQIEHFFLSSFALSWIGLALNVALKASKFSFYDSSRELVYMSLNDSEKSKGKAAIDMMGAPSGKAGAALTQQTFLLLTAGSQISISPYSGLFFLIVVICWIRSVKTLDSNLTSEMRQSISSQIAVES